MPEIALTPQMMARFTAYFGDEVALLHSGLRMTERYDQFKRIRRGEARIVLGTRSAVFAPLGNIGLIVMDEEQESSYESETAPCCGLPMAFTVYTGLMVVPSTIKPSSAS